MSEPEPGTRVVPLPRQSFICRSCWAQVHTPTATTCTQCLTCAWIDEQPAEYRDELRRALRFP